jgi:hypothetical protein
MNASHDIASVMAPRNAVVIYHFQQDGVRVVFVNVFGPMERGFYYVAISLPSRVDFRYATLRNIRTGRREGFRFLFHVFSSAL